MSLHMFDILITMILIIIVFSSSFIIIIISVISIILKGTKHIYLMVPLYQHIVQFGTYFWRVLNNNSVFI